MGDRARKKKNIGKWSQTISHRRQRVTDTSIETWVSEKSNITASVTRNETDEIRMDKLQSTHRSYQFRNRLLNYYAYMYMDLGIIDVSR